MGSSELERSTPSACSRCAGPPFRNANSMDPESRGTAPAAGGRRAGAGTAPPVPDAPQPHRSIPNTAAPEATTALSAPSSTSFMCTTTR
jgi:hypothetical protein